MVEEEEGEVRVDSGHEWKVAVVVDVESLNDHV